MSVPERLKSFLQSNQIPYETLAHSTTYTAQGTAALMQVSGREIAKTVVVRAGERGEQTVLAVLPGACHVKLEKLAAAVGKPVRSWSSSICSPIANLAPCRRSARCTICRSIWTSRWRKTKKLSSTRARITTRCVSATKTSCVSRNRRSARLRSGTAASGCCHVRS